MLLVVYWQIDFTFLLICLNVREELERISFVDINQFYYFLEICRCGKMSKAAEKLHISQQGLSVAMRRLESELGRDLFYRKSKGLILTNSGKFFKEEAESIVRHLNEINSYFSNQANEKIPINVTVTESIIVRLPTSLQQLLINGNQDFSIKLTEDYSANCTQRVLEGESDFGIVYGTAWNENLLESVTIDEVQQVIIVNLRHPFAEYDEISVGDLSGSPMVACDMMSWPRINLGKLFEEKHAQLNVVYECNRPRQTIDLVANNPNLIARTILDEVTSLDLAKIKVLRLKDDPFLMPVNLIHRKGKSLSPGQRFFKYTVLNAYNAKLQ